MDTTDATPGAGASTNVLLREGKAIYPKVMKSDGHHPEIGMLQLLFIFHYCTNVLFTLQNAPAKSLYG